MYVYKVTINDPLNTEWHGKFYIGASLKPFNNALNDGYYGSGAKIKEYISIYGTDSILKETLHSAANKELLSTLEYNEILSSHLHKDSMNIHVSRNIGAFIMTDKGKKSISDHQKNLFLDGGHNFLDSDGCRQREIKKVDAGCHRFQSEDYIKNIGIPAARKAGNIAAIKEYKCPNCNKTGKGGNFRVNHFDYCKSLENPKRKKSIPVTCPKCSLTHSRWPYALKELHFNNCNGDKNRTPQKKEQ